MPDLLSLVTGYLDSDGYSVQRQRDREIIGERPGPAGTRDRIYVWVPEVSRSRPFNTQEGPYLRRFSEANNRHPSATKMLVVPSMQGLSTEFRTKARREHRVGIRVPVQFFDTEFKWEHDTSLPSTAKQLKTNGEEADANRIEQPFTATGRYPGDGADLVAELFRRLHGNPRQTGIHIVQGPAGIGKSYSFSSLFAQLHEAFIVDKQGQRTQWARPMPLMPEYDPGQLRLNGLLTVFMQTELERLIPTDLFHWMLANGQSIWMLDGLEEIMAGDDKFTEIVLDSFTRPGTGGEPTILICLRDSMMNTNQPIIDFCSEYNDYTTVYTLERWTVESIRAFANRRVRTGNSLTFLKRITSSSELIELASLPYYCNLMVEQFNQDGLLDANTGPDLVSSALEAIIGREYDKGLALNENVLPIADVLTFAQDMAQQDMQGGFNGILVGNISDWARDWAEAALEDPSARRRFVFQMSQMALFAQDPTSKKLRFTQEILEQYLLGRLYVDYLRKNERSRFVDEFNYWQFPASSITLELLADYCSTEIPRTSDVQVLVFEALYKPTALKNLIQLVSVAGYDATFLEQSLIGRDLSNLKLSHMNLTGVSFSACDLSNTDFDRCILRDTDFSGATVTNTGFLGTDHRSMEGATFDNTTKFHSMRINNRMVVRTADAIRWWNEITSSGPSEETVDELPCRTSEQLRYLFRKFIYPDGRGRRDDLQEANLNRGQRHLKDPSVVTNAAIKHEYLTRSSPIKFRRAEGTKYSEMVEFVRDFRLSPDLHFLLDDVCNVDECRHLNT